VPGWLRSLSERLSPVLGEERERVAPGGVLTCTFDECRHAGRQDLGLREWNAVLEWHDERGGQRRVADRERDEA
jgi:hypothetical protein